MEQRRYVSPSPSTVSCSLLHPYVGFRYMQDNGTKEVCITQSFHCFMQSTTSLRGFPVHAGQWNKAGMYHSVLPLFHAVYHILTWFSGACRIMEQRRYVSHSPSIVSCSLSHPYVGFRYMQDRYMQEQRRYVSPSPSTVSCSLPHPYMGFRCIS
ncbi:hypothetical protein J6590_031743 [Homalodisca vitripennis]|nr:hypothetical protein J6590_031743 [Homalodisca vitripennis]